MCHALVDVLRNCHQNRFSYLILLSAVVIYKKTHFSQTCPCPTHPFSTDVIPVDHSTWYIVIPWFFVRITVVMPPGKSVPDVTRLGSQLFVETHQCIAPFSIFIVPATIHGRNPIEFYRYNFIPQNGHYSQMDDQQFHSGPRSLPGALFHRRWFRVCQRSYFVQ